MEVHHSSLDATTTTTTTTTTNDDCPSSSSHCKILTVGDGDLTLTVALARAYGNHGVSVTASVLDTRETLLQSFPDAPLAELKDRHVPVLFQVDATQLHQNFPRNHWDLVVFHHPHLGLATLSQDEGKHAIRHYQLLCHYLYSAQQVSRFVQVCLCGTQRDTWRLDQATKKQSLRIIREMSTAVPFSKLWSDGDETAISEPRSDWAAPRRYRNGKLGSRHFLGKYGYRHRRTAGERYHGSLSDMNVAGSIHYVLEATSEENSTEPKPLENIDTECPICGEMFSSVTKLNTHLKAPALPEVAEAANTGQQEEVKDAGNLDQDDHSSTVRGSLIAPSSSSVASKEIQYQLMVEKCHEGRRLRWFLQKNTNLSKNQAEAAVTGGRVFVDGAQVLESSRILMPGMKVELLSSEAMSGPSTVKAVDSNKLQPLEVLYNHTPFLVVHKPAGTRTKGLIPGTLESRMSEQMGNVFESLSKLDTSTGGVCAMILQSAIEESVPDAHRPEVQHSVIALLHGQVPMEWFPRYVSSMGVVQKWRKRKLGSDQHDSVTDGSGPVDATTVISIVPLERTGGSGDKGDDISAGTHLSTVRIETHVPSASSICQWMRQLGHPVVGDMNCRREYLGLKRPIRNRIKNKVCLMSHQVQWVDECGKIMKVPSATPEIPERLSATYWESNFGAEQSKSQFHVLEQKAG